MTIQYRRMEGFEIVELSGEIPAAQMQQLITIAIESLTEEPLLHVRVDGLSAADKEQWVGRFWIQSNLDDDRYRLFAVRDLSSGQAP